MESILLKDSRSSLVQDVVGEWDMQVSVTDVDVCLVARTNGASLFMITSYG